VTGASSGIGAATARRLAAEGFAVVIGARRIERLEQLAGEIEADGGMATASTLDVTDPASVDAFCQAVDECHVLVNNAGGAFGLEPVAEADERQWTAMYETNVLGLLRVTQALLLPKLIASGNGHVVNIGSVAGFEVYLGGAGYNAAKHAVRAITRVMRLELVAEPVRITEIDPGMVETEFSMVRFGGDSERADKVYKGVTPLVAGDIADCIAFAVTRPRHVNIDELVVRPRQQASATLVHRESDPE
jgi:NADP-dependent 3-hydroxy acid dehydrogenase YdfG